MVPPGRGPGGTPSAVIDLRRDMDFAEAGRDMCAFMAELFPICRSITGQGVRDTLARIGAHIDLQVHEIPTGTQVLDWTVPREWNIRAAHVADPSGRTVIDFGDSNLHVVGYSVPVRKTIPLAELKRHLFSLPDHPDWIPYRTAYYAETWGFCMRHRDLEALEEGDYEVVIDSTLEDGSLTYGECFLPGDLEEEILIHCHTCHPSLANDNLSGIALATFLAKHLRELPTRYSYRFLFLPGTIGAIAWLGQNQDHVDRIRHGLVVCCVGDPGAFTYKQSRRSNADIDRAVEYVLSQRATPYGILEFEPWGYDERQYCSPGFDLPVGSLTRSRNGAYPEYHTSADDLDLVVPEAIGESLEVYLDVLDVLEHDRPYRNLSPKGEPQLGRRGLYPSIGGQQAKERQLALLWVLNLSDGNHGLLDIAVRSRLPFAELRWAVEALTEHGLLAPPEADGPHGVGSSNAR